MLAVLTRLPDNPTSNVAVPTFQPSYGNPFVGFEGEVDEATDIANEMFVVSSSYDESTFVPNKRPNATDLYPIYKVSSTFHYISWFRRYDGPMS